MNVMVTGQHIEITPAIREYVLEKMVRIKRHFDHLIEINIVLRVEKMRQHVEANVHVNGKDIFVEATNTDMYAAIDEMSHTLDRQIIRHKEKQHESRSAETIRHHVED
jgi:putative sigma-54 modulation protein